jgi:hypothetical protein
MTKWEAKRGGNELEKKKKMGKHDGEIDMEG